MRRARVGLARTLGRTALLGVVVLAGLLAPLAQAGIGAVDAAPFGVAAGVGSGPGATYAANTLARFRASGNAWGQTPAYDPPLPPPAHATGTSAAAVGQTASSTTLAQPVSIALDPILLSDGSAPAGPALSYTSGDELLGLAVSEHSLDLSQAALAGPLPPAPSPAKGGGASGAAGATPVGPYTLTLTPLSPQAPPIGDEQRGEVIHTTARHPFLTRGQAGGGHVRHAGGRPDGHRDGLACGGGQPGDGQPGGGPGPFLLGGNGELDCV